MTRATATPCSKPPSAPGTLIDRFVSAPTARAAARLPRSLVHPYGQTGPAPGLCRALQAAAPWALASLLVAGCGGGGTNVVAEQTAAPQAKATAATASVQLEGCVINAQGMGAPGTAVHVRTAEGSTVGTAFTNSRGVYVVAVPARSSIVLDTAVAGPGALALITGSASLSVAGCLFVDL